MIQISNFIANLFIFSISLGIIALSTFALLIFLFVLKDWFEQYRDK